jgi:hypothetical protein
LLGGLRESNRDAVGIRNAVARAKRRGNDAIHVDARRTALRLGRGEPFDRHAEPVLKGHIPAKHGFALGRRQEE